jgi:peptidoglycan/LPS O-acetylase OafA/YrhL
MRYGAAWDRVFAMGTAELRIEHRITYLDGWRGLAILGVIVGHFANVAGINLGRVGVELFFVLSGRLMADILFVRREPLGRFFPRRFSRIYSTLFVFVTAAFLANSLLHASRMGFADYAAAVTLTYNYYALFAPRTGVIDQLWSLCVEEHVYLLLGAIAALNHVRQFPLLPVLAALAIAGCLDGALCTWPTGITIMSIGEATCGALPF